MTDTRTISTSRLLDLLFENAGAGLCLVAPDDTIVRVNAEWLRSTGFTRDVIGADVVELFPATRDMALALHARARAGHHVEVPRHAQVVNGRETWWEGSVDPVPMDGGTGLLITAREVAPASPTHGNTGVLQNLIDGSPSIIFLKDLDGRFITINKALEELLGMRREELAGKTDYDLFPPERAEYYRAHDRTVIETRRLLQVEEVADLADGKHHVFLANKFPVYDEAGRLFAVCGISHDVTERRRAEEALREGEERYRNLFAKMGEGFAVGEAICDAAGKPVDFRFLEMNDAFERQSGLRRDTTRGRPMREVLPHLEQFWIDTYCGVALGGPEVRFEQYNRDLDRHFSVNCFSPTSGRFAILFSDITDQKRGENAIRESEAQLRRLYDSGMIGVLHFDMDGAIYDANDRFLEMVGYSRADLESGKVAWDRMTPPEYRAADEFAVAELKARGVDTPYEKEYVRKDGSRVSILIGAATYDDARHRGIAFVLDVSDRKRVEQELRASAGRLNLALDAGRMVAWDYDPATKRVTMSENAREVLATRGSRVHEDSDQGFGLIHPEDVEKHRALVADAMERVGEYISLYRQVADGGEVLWIEERGRALRDEGGKTVRLVGVTQNVTERKRAEEALRASEERLRLAVEAGELGTWDLDLTTGKATRSLRHDQIFGYAEAQPEWSVERALRHIVPEDRQKVQDAHTPAPGKQTMYVEARLRRADDAGIRWVMSTGRFLCDDRGRPVRLTGICADITERKHAEEQLRTANERLREADRRKDEFLATLSHELRNPLAPIRNALYILDRAEPGGQQAHRARDIANRQVAHLTRLVDDLLDVTRIARGKIELRRANLDLAALARRTAEDHRAVMQERRLELAVDAPAHPVIVEGDEVRLAQVLGNLLTNAAKFTPTGGKVTLSIATDGPNAVTHVRDTGPGIEPELLESIFSPFTQAKQTLARSEGGLGLGLALVKGLVALHGGEVVARNEWDGGADFVVTLPLAVAPERPAVAGETQPNRGTGRRRVLVVDDNHDAAHTLADVVKMLGHEVEVAHDGEGALRVAREHAPDVVLCDIGLPGMDGYAVARELRRLAPDHVRIIAVSGYAQPEDVARATEAGFDGHVAKPVDPERIGSLLS